MPINVHGLDVSYFREKLNEVLQDIDLYSPIELSAELNRLNLTATQAHVRVKSAVPEGFVEVDDTSEVIKKGWKWLEPHHLNWLSLDGGNAYGMTVAKATSGVLGRCKIVKPIQ